jgi:hypothetical protein
VPAAWRSCAVEAAACSLRLALISTWARTVSPFISAVPCSSPRPRARPPPQQQAGRSARHRTPLPAFAGV